MSDNNVRWEPITDHEELIDMGFDAAFGPKPNGTMNLYIAVPDDAGAGELSLPPDIRLCRAVPVTWSQEPPTEAGNWWIWRPGDRRPVCVNISYLAGDNQHWAVTGDGLGYVLPRNEPMRNRWWCKAVVPQPPGEVGE